MKSTAPATEADTPQNTITIRPGERLVRTERFLVELKDTARAMQAKRGPGIDGSLRRLLREASRAGRIPCIPMGNGFAYRLADAARVALILGYVPDDTPEEVS